MVFSSLCLFQTHSSTASLYFYLSLSLSFFNMKKGRWRAPVGHSALTTLINPLHCKGMGSKTSRGEGLGWREVDFEREEVAGWIKTFADACSLHIFAPLSPPSIPLSNSIHLEEDLPLSALLFPSLERQPCSGANYNTARAINICKTHPHAAMLLQRQRGSGEQQENVGHVTEKKMSQQFKGKKQFCQRREVGNASFAHKMSKKLLCGGHLIIR